MYLKKTKPRQSVNLSNFTTLGVGGEARCFFKIKDTLQLSNFLKKIKNSFYLLGNGSNLLIQDKTIKKPVVKLTGSFQQVRQRKSTTEVGASTLLSFLVKYCIYNNLGGIENLAGIPATIGGMLASGASSFGTTIFDCLRQVELMDKAGKIYRVKKDDIDYGYRHSSLHGKIILKAFFRFVGKNHKVKVNIRNIVKKRIASQDFSLPSCGSIFKNPASRAAGEVIEEVGLKGRARGGMKISDKHANFIVNLGNGSYQDADYLIKLIKDTVYQKKGIILEEEIERWS